MLMGKLKSVWQTFLFLDSAQPRYGREKKYPKASIDALAVCRGKQVT